MSGDFREFFDLRGLDEQKLGQIEWVLNSPAYESTFKPYLQGVYNQMQSLWRDRSQQRKDQYPDDFLAGGVCAIEGLLKFFAIVIEETRMERVHASMEGMTPERLYERKRQAGQMRPVVGLDQRAEPEHYNPAEDF